MGGHASRDALDVDLARTELEILSSPYAFIADVKEYSRMVDDISTIVQGDFSSTVKLLILMARLYPDMPLNIQLSFCYSRFLDIHLYNIYTPSIEYYNLHTTLAWKDMNSFCYQPRWSNKPPLYKAAVVPITMHRIYKRCSLSSDRDHHRVFILRILQHRSQDMKLVAQSMAKYNKRLRTTRNRAKSTTLSRYKQSYSVTYDSHTKSHVFVTGLVKRCDKHRIMRPILISLPSLASILCPKRAVITKLRKHALLMPS